MIQGQQLIIVLVVLLVLFGGRKLPELARSIGEAQRELKKNLADDAADDSSDQQS